MAEWPVVVVGDTRELEYAKKEHGAVIRALHAKIGSEGKKRAIWILCPNCGTVGHCPDAAYYDERPKWDVSIVDGKLTMNPSILCACGGHFFLTNGVLRDV